MSSLRRIGVATRAAWHAFLRRRVAVFFTFFFPVLIVLIFGVLVQTGAGGDGLFAEPPGWYVPGYLAVVVLFTPLSRVGSEVARHRDGNRFEKLATTPLTRAEWLFAQLLVNVTVIGLAGVLLLGLLVGLTDAYVAVGLETLLLLPFLGFGVAVFCAIGSLLGSYADSQDGVIASSNTLAITLLFLSETFVPRSMLPGWLPTELSPLTYFARGVRAITYQDGPPMPRDEAVLAIYNESSVALPWVELGVLAALAVVGFVVATRSLPQTD